MANPNADPHPADPLVAAIGAALRTLDRLPDADGVEGFTLQARGAEPTAFIDRKSYAGKTTGHAAMALARVAADLAGAAAGEAASAILRKGGLEEVRCRPSVGGGFLTLSLCGTSVNVNKTHWRRCLRTAWDLAAAGHCRPIEPDPEPGWPQWRITANVGGRYNRDIGDLCAPDPASAVRFALWNDIVACLVRGERLRIDQVLRMADVTHDAISTFQRGATPLDGAIGALLGRGPA